MEHHIKTPIALIVFKRLDSTKAVLERIREVRPRTLFIIADGWRNENEKAKCATVRTYLEDAIDWPCEVKKNYSDKNLGLRKRVTSGLDWVFSEVEEAIILEDDCVPDITFFPFCQELLEKYRNESRVMQISGLNTQFKNPYYDTKGASYYFSQFGEIWGWATWRRAWILNKSTMHEWPKARDEGMLKERLKNPAYVDYWEHLFNEVYEAGDDRKKADVWGAIWVFSTLLQGGFAAVSKTNLITNLGDTEEASHFRGGDRSEEFKRPVTPLTFPLIHPTQIEVNENADEFTLKEVFRIKKTFREKILFFLKRNAPLLHQTLKKLSSDK